MKWWVSLLPVLAAGRAVLWLSHVSAQSSLEHHPVSVTAESMHDPQGEHGGGAWEGSAEGVAYSEFNHRFAGLFVLLFGLAELGYALRYPLPSWTRLVLPGAFGVIGAYLLIWSDHEAWPVGSLTFVQTFSGQDQEIIQHKFYGVFARHCRGQRDASPNRLGSPPGLGGSISGWCHDRRTIAVLAIHMGIIWRIRRSSFIMHF